MSDSETFERCMAVGGVAVFPADTVYGLACDPENRFAVERLYLLKRRPLEKPSAVMFFDLELAFASVPELGERTREAMRRLLPGPVSLLVANPAGRFPLACGSDRLTLGLRVPVVARLEGVRRPVLQSSANRAGGADPRRIEDVPALIRAAADMLIDGGELPGTPSTVIDLRSFEDTGAWTVVRPGAVDGAAIHEALHDLHFDPARYGAWVREEIPAYDRFQDEVVAASGAGARRILELGTGTGETARRLLDRHPDSALMGIDESPSMLAAASDRLDPARASLRVTRLQDPLPEGPFDLVASALCVHHLTAPEKADLFVRVGAVLARGGRFVLGDVVVPADRADARIELTDGYDRPSPLADQVQWLLAAGFDARVSWADGDLAVIVAELPG